MGHTTASRGLDDQLVQTWVESIDEHGRRTLRAVWAAPTTTSAAPTTPAPHAA